MKRKINRLYRRSLPHIYPEGATIFFTYSLDRALPKPIIKKLREQREIEILRIKAEYIDDKIRNEKLQALKSVYFGKYDHLLHDPNSGDRFLEDERVAKIVQDSILHLAKEKYHLICFCIMPNHVHKIVAEKKVFLGHLMQSHKGYTGKTANKILKRSGRFWQRESFDVIIRNEHHLVQKVRYVMNNPVAAGLAKDFRAWRQSYLNPDYEWIMDQ